jgi:hypothetical protein
MLTKEVSQKYFNNALVSIHAARAHSLFEACWSLTKQANLTISSLGRNKDGSAYVKHKIKSIDRLIGNPKLHAELPVVYKEFFQPFIACSSVLYILVDWSGCCREDIHMLRASIVHDGRSVTIYNEIHPQEKLGNRQVHKQFLANLSKQIPFVKRVMIITDAGFATPWFKAVLDLGWDYIGRLKGDIKLLFNDRPRWMRVKNLHKKAKAQGRYEGDAIIGSSSSTPVRGNIYSYKKIPKKRKGQSRYPDVNKRYSAANRTPWIIATSLKTIEYSKSFIKNKYENRMQIEQNFRDDKDPRFGFGWRFARNSSMERIAVLCLIASIAAFFLLTIGILAEKLGIHRKYQVNSTKKKRVLSLLTLAKQILQHDPPRELSQNYEKATRQLIISNEILYGY